ncbi:MULTISPECIES: MOSC N-terminal beta barrel domain-containing protein [unclassified Actinopolyspora]|uniref:MOSC domain-containing protein n=1 Tax=unclassified Actinopolyspora TaxID=2639451 RepID=UPI0013F6357E|nr:MULTISPECIES: MOSC N-terminal beta barrel domain-containing protein [unclassified Actinopolyspora]NHD18159.1 MOSC domain-containing protein [Actinopolyspora sp. BKK2]NHE77164.1 MOSC domain-containing protein [Actinopolyspora sp. BKK1]
MAEITELVYYPVKGCAGITVGSADLTPAGLRHDRCFMVVDERGGFRSQRKDPGMAVIRPEIDPDGTRLTLHAPGVESVAIEVDTAATARSEVELHGAGYLGIDQGDTAAEWFSAVLGTRCRLVHVPPEHDRVTGGLTEGTSGYADSCPILVVSEESLRDVNERLTERGLPALPMNRFRPNIVVAGWREPHTEDLVRRGAAGDVELGYAKIAKRCAVTTVEQTSGRKDGPEPLRVLAEYRRTEGNGVAFGSKFAVLRAGKLSVGDEFGVTEWGTSEL